MNESLTGPPSRSRRAQRRTRRTARTRPTARRGFGSRSRRTWCEFLERRLLLTAAVGETTPTAEIVWQGRSVEVVADQWIVRYDADSPSLDSAVELQNLLNAADSDLNAGRIGPFPQQLRVRRPLAETGVFLLETARDVASDRLENIARGVTGVRYLEPNLVLSVDTTIPDDPLFDQLWGLHNTGQSGGRIDADIDAAEVWDRATGSTEVVVAGIDTGIDYNHEDLAANMWVNPLECPTGTCVADGIDDDGNGYVDDFYGIDTASGDSDPMDGHGHGTHTAGTIGAVGDNSLGVTGVNWNVRIMALKFLTDGGSGSLAGAIEAIDYMTMMKRDHGVNIVASSNSWSGGGFSQALQDSIQASIDQGIMFVAASANNGLNTDFFPAYPSSYPLDGIISVAATDRNDNLAVFSNYGAVSVDLGAPGVDILSTVPGDSYGTMSGTSMAAPHVTGAVALITSLAPQASLAEIKAAVLDNVDLLPSLNGRTVTGGRLNVNEALLSLGMRVVASQPTVDEVLFSQPTEFTLHFSEPYDPATVQADDFSVNGVEADDFVFVPDDEDTITFLFDTSPVSTQGPQAMTLAADSIARQFDGDLNTEFEGEFRYDETLLEVDSSTPVDGSLVVLPFTTLSLDFNEPIDPDSVGINDLVLSQGVVSDAHAIGNHTAVYTLTNVAQEGPLTFNLLAGAVTDSFGNPGAAHSGSFSVDIETVGFDRALERHRPAGSLVHSASRHGETSFVGDVDSLTFDVAAGQTLAVLVSPASGLRPSVNLYDPSGNLWASATASAVGADALVQALPTTQAGTYRIEISGTAGTTGAYEVQYFWNAALEEESHGGGTNGSPATAQPLESAWVTLDGESARAALLGALPNVSGVPIFSEDFDGPTHSFLLDNGAASGNGLWHSSTGRQDDGLPLHSPSGNLYFGHSEIDTEGGSYDVGGPVGGAAVSPVISLPDQGNVTLSFNHFLETESDEDWDEARVVIEDGANRTTLLSGADGTLPTGTGGQWQSVTADLTPFRGLDVSIRFVFDSFDGTDNDHEGWFVDDVVVFGEDDSVRDYYRLELEQGDSVTVAVASESEEVVRVDLLDSSAQRLALSGSSADLDSIDSLVIAQRGTYYAVVSGQGNYSLVVSRNAGLDREHNNTIATAQSMTASTAVGFLGLESSGEPSASSAGNTSDPVDTQPGAEFVSGELIVRFAEGLSSADAQSLIESRGALVLKQLPLIDGAVVQLPFGLTDMLAAAADLASEPGILYAEPNFVVRVDETIPSDPLFDDLWALRNTGQTGGSFDADIDASDVWDLVTDSSGVVVAGIDTGVDYTHEDLVANMWTNPAECPGGACVADGVDDDGNGFVDDFHGIDTAFDDSDPMDGHGHGTHTVGTIGAVGDNGIGVAGINWNVQIMALKFLTDGGSGTIDDAIEAIDYMTMMKRDYGVNVVASNNSWSGGDYSQALLDAIQASIDEGIMFVAASGNDGLNNDIFPAYPSSYEADGIISVAATDHNDSLAYFSNYGATSVDLAAPGVSIRSTTPGNNYSYSTGTSMAAPHVAGVVALLAAAAPQADLAQIKAAILNGADPVSDLGGVTLTGGRLNVAEAFFEMGDPGDNYRLDVVAGDVLAIHTSLPGTETLGFGNALDPQIQLYDPAGSLVAADDNGAGDGRNASVSHVADTTGAYTIRVFAASGDGEYLLHVSGNTGQPSEPSITATGPADGQTLFVAPTEMTVEFSDAVLLSSLSSEDLLIDGAPSPGIRTVAQRNVVVFRLPSLSEGSHTFEISAGAILDTGGRPFQATDGSFSIDFTTHPVSTDELVAYWNFDEGSGSIANDSAPHPNDHSGLLQDDTQWVDFGLGGSLNFDGEGDFVAVPDSPDLNTGDHRDRSVSAWFFVRDKSITSRKQVIFEEGGSWRGANIYVHDGRLYVGGWNISTNESGWEGTFLSTDQIESERWHHVVLTLDGGRTLEEGALTAYLDGVPFGSGAGSQLWSRIGDIGIGQVTGIQETSTGATKFHTGDQLDDGEGFAGLIDEVRVYNRALSDGEAQTLSAQPMVDPVVLTLALDDVAIWENGDTVLATVTRDGDLSDALTVTLEASDPSEVSLPTSVTIPADESQASFVVSGLDDPLADGAQTLTITVSADGYLGDRRGLDVWDDEPAVGDLVAYWSFDEGDGTTAHDTSPAGNDNSATLQGDATWSEFGLNGSLSLDGEDDFASIPDSNDLNTTTTPQRTISSWFYVRDKSIDSRKQVVFEEGGSSRGLNIYVHDGSLYVGGWNTYESGWSGTFLSTDQIQSERWHHVLLVLDGGTTITPDALKGYLDGAQFGEGPGSQLWSHTGDMGIGQVTGFADQGVFGTTKYPEGDAPADGDGWYGLLDEMRIYNRVLTSPEIQVLATQQLVDPVLLTLEIDDPAIPENGGSTSATVTRSGDTNGPLTVTLASSDPSEATVPDFVTIPPNESQVTFTITAVDETVADGAQSVLITATAPGYLEGRESVDVLDDEPADAELVAWWNFNEGSGTTAEDTSPAGNDHVGTLQGDAGWSSFGLDGALVLDGDGDYVSLADSNDLNTTITQRRTISAWFYVHDASIDDRKQVVFEEGGPTRGLNIYVHDGRLYVGGWNTLESGWSGTFLNTDQISSGRWHHVALVLDGGTSVAPNAFKGYLDGVLFGQGDGSQLWSHTGDMGIGQVTGYDSQQIFGTTKFHTGDAQGDGHGLDGLLDEIRIYNRVLSDSEIDNLAGRPLVDPPVVSLSLQDDSILENGGATIGTVRRLGVDTGSSLLVSLSSSDPGEVSVPSSVTIPAGETEATFAIVGVDDSLADGAQSVSMTATAAGFLSGNALLRVLDDEPAEADLVAYWTFDDGTGLVAADSSPYGSDNSGTLQGDAGWNGFGLGGSLMLDGDGDFVALADSNDLNTRNTPQRTVSAWFRVNDKSIDTRKQIIFEEGGSTRGLNIYVDAGQLVVGGWNTSESGWSGTFLSTDQFASGTWHHVALVLDGGTSVTPDALKAYLDGELYGVGPGSQLWSHTGDMGIGQVYGFDSQGTLGTSRYPQGVAPADGDGWDGMLDEMRIYNRALSEPEIQVLAGQSLLEPQLLTLTIEDEQITENGGGTLVTVARVGGTTDAVEITIDNSDAGAASVPTTVTIEAGETDASFSLSTLDDTIYTGPRTLALTASAAGYLGDQATVTVDDDEQLLRTGIAGGVSNTWTTVNLPQDYQSMVVVATPRYDNTSVPLVTRIRNVTANSFELKVDRADSSTAAFGSIDVHFVVADQGVYSAATHGIKMEAVRFNSSVTDSTSSWNGQAVAYQNAYSQPVVVGQVMSYNDADFSVFWSRGSSATSPPSNATLRVGKHVGEHGDKTRTAETLGYLVIEAGSGTVGGRGYTAGVGSDSVQGIGNSPSYDYSLSGLASASTAVAGLAGMDGTDGAWAVLYGADPVTGTTLRLAADEDRYKDNERQHTHEQVAYLVLDEPAPGASSAEPAQVAVAPSALIADGGSAQPARLASGDSPLPDARPIPTALPVLRAIPLVAVDDYFRHGGETPPMAKRSGGASLESVLMEAAEFWW